MSRVNPFQEYFESLLKDAFAKGASDIHIEPFESEVLIKFRVDGVLRIISRETDGTYIARLSEIIKKACKFDMGLAGFPQDNRFNITGLNADFRASLCPTSAGEKIVLRLLQRQKSFDLETYPLIAQAKTALKKALGKWQGLIIVSGPTGSGKSTLLYSALGTIDRVQNNVHTIEDPIEYSLPYLNQTQVKRGTLSFADVIRSLMRQDPDVILIGEIRDEETAEAAIHAASTGHLVLSTVHANSANEIIDRIVGLGIKRELLVSNLLFASAQRLVPNLCLNCIEDDEEESRVFSKMKGVSVKVKLSKGCSECHEGYKGRSLLFEWITSERSDGQYALQNFGSLSENAIQLLMEGKIDAQTAYGII